jgi:hypothetical protein
VDIIGEWYGCKSTDPLYARGYMYVYLYFKNNVIFEGDFKILNRKGIYDCNYIDGIIKVKNTEDIISKDELFFVIPKKYYMNENGYILYSLR